MKAIKLLVVSLCLSVLAGCAGVIVAGAAATVNVVTDERNAKEMWRDNNIEFEVAGLANKAPYKGNTRFKASSYKGVVVLMGQSPDQGTLDQFVQRVNQLEGVNSVYNQVRIKAPLSLTDISKDSWITTKVKSQLLTETELIAKKIKVITEDGEVFLTGWVSQQDAEQAVEIARNVSGVKRVVKAFQYSK